MGWDLKIEVYWRVDELGQFGVKDVRLYQEYGWLFRQVFMLMEGNGGE